VRRFTGTCITKSGRHEAQPLRHSLNAQVLLFTEGRTQADDLSLLADGNLASSIYGDRASAPAIRQLPIFTLIDSLMERAVPEAPGSCADVLAFLKDNSRLLCTAEPRPVWGLSPAIA
jgi:hypothetical protein